MASKEKFQNTKDLQFLPHQAISFDIEAFNSAIHSQGVTLIHWRAQRCPVGMIDPYDVRRPHDDHANCSNGFIYVKAGAVTCLFTGNSHNVTLQDPGLMNGSTVQVTFPQYYDSSEANCRSDEPISIIPFDRLYLSEESIVVPHWQLFQSHASGREKLSFPAVKVYDIIDSDNNHYGEGDFEVRAGQIVWLGSHRPKSNQVCSIRYAYRPYYYIKELIHEVRVAQASDPVTGDRITNRMPQSAILAREYIFENEQKDPESVTPNSQRQVKSPESGEFGPR